MAKRSKPQYHKPNIGKFVGALCEKYQLDSNEVVTFLKQNFPELSKKDKCANCQASMAIYSFSITVLDALLLAEMGRIVYERLKNGMSFTAANKVHLSTAIKGTNSSRQTIASKLGLITKVKKGDGSHDRKAGWLITRRGFEFLAGKPVPAKVQVFRNQITERFEEMTDIGVVASGQLGAYNGILFDELEHYSIAGMAQGTLL